VTARRRTATPKRTPARTAAAAWARLERVLAAAMTAPDPASALEAASRDRALDADTRRRLATAATHDDGLRIAALLVARLRFERLMRGSPDAEDFYDRDPAGFTRAFRDYHESVPPTAFFPAGEAKLWAAWRAGR
jgi:hypothetical protein